MQNSNDFSTFFILSLLAIGIVSFMPNMGFCEPLNGKETYKIIWTTDCGDNRPSSYSGLCQKQVPVIVENGILPVDEAWQVVEDINKNPQIFESLTPTLTPTNNWESKLKNYFLKGK